MSQSYQMKVTLEGRETVRADAKVTLATDINDKLVEMGSKKLKATIQRSERTALLITVPDLDARLQVNFDRAYAALDAYDKETSGIVQIDSSGLGELREGTGRLFISPA
jgi:hypothetical protein